jgi:hypothetical protein
MSNMSDMKYPSISLVARKGSSGKESLTSSSAILMTFEEPRSSCTISWAVFWSMQLAF